MKHLMFRGKNKKDSIHKEVKEKIQKGKIKKK